MEIFVQTGNWNTQKENKISRFLFFFKNGNLFILIRSEILSLKSGKCWTLKPNLVFVNFWEIQESLNVLFLQVCGASGGKIGLNSAFGPRFFWISRIWFSRTKFSDISNQNFEVDLFAPPSCWNNLFQVNCFNKKWMLHSNFYFFWWPEKI
jgi:hypothetical protein